VKQTEAEIIHVHLHLLKKTSGQLRNSGSRIFHMHKRLAALTAGLFAAVTFAATPAFAPAVTVPAVTAATAANAGFVCVNADFFYVKILP